MDFNSHSNLAGLHALLSPSDYHWINYSEEKLDRVFYTRQEARRGTEFHELAQRMIRMSVRLPDEPKTLNMYVNDAIGYKMTPEQTLFYSANCFGTADAIGYRRNCLRIYDLKMGVNPASMHQLEVYASLFCLEYGFKPSDIEMDLRIYQNNEVAILVPSPVDISLIMDKIKVFDRRIKFLRSEAL